MSKFNKGTATASPLGPVRTAGPTATFEGGPAFSRDAKSDLFLLAVTNMVGEDTFYESAGARDDRFRQLVHQVAVLDGDWLGRFIGWLRSEANMRSASVVAAVEAVKARLAAGLSGGNRTLINAACQRADEPGEVLAYWTSRYGRAIPKPVKRGVADAVARLYSGKSLLKYDSDAKGFRFGDVIELVHPAPHPDKPWQGDVFKYAVDRRHRGAEAEIPISNKSLGARTELNALAPAERHMFMRRVQAGDEAAKRKFEAAMATQWEWAKSWLGA